MVRLFLLWENGRGERIDFERDIDISVGSLRKGIVMKKLLDLTGRKYIVTGASSGIGRVTCKYLAELGATIILVARNEERLQQCMGELSGKDHRYYCFDLSQVEDIKGFIKKVVKENGKLDGFVHSAGTGTLLPLKNETNERVKEVMQINFLSFLEMVRIFSLGLYNTRQGSIVGISSYGVVLGLPGQSSYLVSKSGMESMVKTAAKELLEQGVRINCVQPGWVKTEMMDQYLSEVGDNDRAVGITSNALDSVEVASVIAFLLSDQSSGINGAVIPVLGSWLGGQ